MYEAYVTQETAIRMKEMDESRPDSASNFGAALGMPVVVRDDIPPNIVRIVNNGAIVRDINLDEET